MEKSYKVVSGTNGFKSEYTQLYLEEQHLQIRHIDESGEEHKFEVQPSGWTKNGKTMEGTAESHVIRLWENKDGDTLVFISEEREKKKRVSRLW